MPHMVAAEHLTLVQANRYGTARTQATIAAALAAIGSTNATLVLTMSGDGVWTLSGPGTFSIPNNVILQIPNGVTVNVPSGVTFAVGLVIASNSAWKTGSGTVTKSVGAPPMEISNVVCTSYAQSTSGAGSVWELNAGVGSVATIRMYLNNANTTGLQISRNDLNTDSTWQLLTVNDGSFHVVRPGSSTKFRLDNTGLMLNANAAPSFNLQVSGTAAKTGGGSWTDPASDARVKTITPGGYTPGLATVLQLQPEVYHYNGKLGLPTEPELVGLIAQAVQPVAPDLVSSYRAKLNPEDAEETDVLTVDTTRILYMLINAAKEIDTRLQTLEGMGGAIITHREQVAHTPTVGGSAAATVPSVPTARGDASAPEKPAPPRRTRREH